MIRSRLHSIRAASLGLTVLLAGCGGLLPTPDLSHPSPAAAGIDDIGFTIDVANGTKLAVTIVVNGTAVAVIEPGQGGTVKPGMLPPKPWAVEARSPSGRVLSRFNVVDGQVTRTVRADGGVEMSGAGARVDLSCGRLDVTVGPPMLGPAPGPGRPGDCEP